MYKPVIDLGNVHLDNKLDLELGYQLQPVASKEYESLVGCLVVLSVRVERLDH